jgi:signal transduction histidine kinase
VTHRNGERVASRWEEPLGTLLRFVALIAIGYGIVALGGFAKSVPTMIAAVIGIAAMLAVVVTDRWPASTFRIVVLAAMLFAGAILGFELAPIGWALFAAAAFNLIGKPEIRLRIAVVLVAAAGVVFVVATALAATDDREPIWMSLVVVGLGALGYSRRQRRLRRRQEEELVERSRELEERSLEVIAQTETARIETARAAALEERNRIARDMHDLLAHSLGGLVAQLDAADALLAAGREPAAVADRIRTSRQLAVEGLREARQAVRELRRDEVAGDDEPADLVARLTTLVRGPVGLQLGVEFEVVGDPREVPGRVVEAFAAVAREAMTNLNKHATGARSVITVIFTASEIRLEVINSIPGGPSPAEVDHGLAGTDSGLGIPGMRQRFAEIGGTAYADRHGDRWQVSASWPTAALEPVEAQRIESTGKAAEAE